MRALLLALVLTAALAGPGCTAEQVLVGRVSLAGSAPHAYLRVLSPEGEFRLVGPQEPRLREQWQGREARIEGRVVKQAVGPGFPAEFEVRRIEEVGPER